MLLKGAWVGSCDGVATAWCCCKASSCRLSPNIPVSSAAWESDCTSTCRSQQHLVVPCVQTGSILHSLYLHKPAVEMVPCLQAVSTLHSISYR